MARANNDQVVRTGVIHSVLKKRAQVTGYPLQGIGSEQVDQPRVNAWPQRRSQTFRPFKSNRFHSGCSRR